MAKSSDIIKIGFDYRASLEQFVKETNGVFDGISEKAGKQRISIQLDAKNDKVIEKIKELQKLKLDKFTFEFGESGLAEQLKTFDQLEKKIDEIINLSKGINNIGSGNGIGNSIVDEKSLNSIIDLFGKMENHLGEIKKVFTDVGDGGEFSPLLSTIDKINNSVKELSTSVKGIGLNMNIDVGSDSEMEAKVQSKISNALQAYQRLFDHIKMSGAGGSMINTNFFEFDINQYDTMMAKLQAYRKFIENMRNEAKAQFNGKDVLFQGTDKLYWTSASAAMGQVTKAFKEMNASDDTSPLENLFGGKTDLTEVVTQLNLIVDKLGEISTTASEFKNVFANGFNVSASVEEIEKLTNRVKELETELSKVKVSSASPVETNISSPIKDTFQGGHSDNSEASGVKQYKKKGYKAHDTGNHDNERKVANKKELSRVLKELQTEIIASIDESTQFVKEVTDFYDSQDNLVKTQMKIGDKNGSMSTYTTSYSTDKEGNSTAWTSHITTEKVAEATKQASKEIQEEWDKNVKAIQEYMDANTKLNNLKAQDKGTGKKSSEIAYQTKEVERLEKVAIEARAALSSMINPHEAPIDDWNKWLEAMKQFDQATEGSARSVAQLEDALRNMAKSRSDKIKSVIESNQAHLDKLRPTKGNRSVEFENTVQEYNKAIIALREFHATLDSSTPLTKEQAAKYDVLSTSLREARVEMEKFSASEKGSTESSRWKEIDKITKYLEKNTKISKTAKQQLEAFIDTLKNVSGVNVDNIHLQFNKIAEAERAAGREGKRFWDILTDKAVYGAAAQLAGYYLSLTDFIRYTQNGIQTIREFDTALTEMRKVSDETVSSLERFQDVSFDLADGVGTTAKAIQDATADWMRLGESLEEAKQSAQDANVLFRVSEFESIDEATESLVAMSAAYKDLEKSQINDVLNEIGNNYAISTDELASALQKSAATLSVAGNDIYEAAALVTAGNAVLQDADSVGTGLKMISLRILGTQEAKDELASLGEDVDDFVVQTKSKIDETVRNFTAVASNDFKGISVLDDNGNYRSTYEILRDISQIYQEILETDKKAGTNRGQALLEVLAGKNRSNVAASILQSPELLTSAYESAMNSAGSAQEELEKFLESIDGRMAKLENQAQEFWYKLIDSDTIKNGITLLTELLGLATDFVDTFGALGTIGLGAGLFAGIKNVGINMLVAY